MVAELFFTALLSILNTFFEHGFRFYDRPEHFSFRYLRHCRSEVFLAGIPGILLVRCCVLPFNSSAREDPVTSDQAT